MLQLPQETLLETTGAFPGSESSSEISAYTPRAHDWMQNRPCSEASLIALSALAFSIDTATSGDDIHPLEAVRGVLLADGKGYVKDSGYDGVLLSESQQSIITSSVAVLADQIPAALAFGKLGQYAQHVVAARFYDGRIEQLPAPREYMPGKIGSMASKYCFPHPYPAPRKPTTSSITTPAPTEAPSVVAKDRSWHAIHIGPITLGVAFKRNNR